MQKGKLFFKLAFQILMKCIVVLHGQLYVKDKNYHQCSVNFYDIVYCV